MPADIGLKPAGEIPHGPGLRRADRSDTRCNTARECSCNDRTRRQDSMIMVPGAPPQRSTMEMVSISPADLSDARRVDASAQHT